MGDHGADWRRYFCTRRFLILSGAQSPEFLFLVFFFRRLWRWAWEIVAQSLVAKLAERGMGGCRVLRFLFHILRGVFNP